MIKKNSFEIFIGIFTLLFIVIGSAVLVFADTNGVWHYASDIRGGVLGSDEGFPSFTLNSTLNLGDNAFFRNSGNSDTIIRIDSGSNTSQYSSIDFYDRGTKMWGIGKDPLNNFYIHRPGMSNYLVIDLSGNIGIGNLNPTEKLDVNGSIRASQRISGSNIRNVSCLSNHYLSGFDNQSNIICTLLPVYNITSPPPPPPPPVSPPVSPPPPPPCTPKTTCLGPEITTTRTVLGSAHCGLNPDFSAIIVHMNCIRTTVKCEAEYEEYRCKDKHTTITVSTDLECEDPICPNR